MRYETVSDALTELRKKGYTVDFNLPENRVVFHSGNFNTNNFRIVDVYRYEGTTDPADESTVYAIESVDGLKGFLVTGYGTSVDPASEAILQRLDITDQPWIAAVRNRDSGKKFARSTSEGLAEDLQIGKALSCVGMKYKIE